MAELFTLNPLFAGRTEGLQFFEHMCLLGKPEKKYFDRFSLTSEVKNYLLSFEEVKKYDLRKVINANGIYSVQDIELAVDLIDKCLLWEWDSRIAAEEAVNHPFFTEFEKQ
jgi:cell division cycle 2-like protein